MCIYTWTHIYLHTYEHPYKNACVYEHTHIYNTHTYKAWGGERTGVFTDYRSSFLWITLSFFCPLCLQNILVMVSPGSSPSASNSVIWCLAQDIYANANVTSHFPWALFYLFWSIVHVLVFAPFGMFYVCYRVRIPFYPSCGFSVYPAPYWPVFPYHDSWYLNPCMFGLISGLSFLSNWPV